MCGIVGLLVKKPAWQEQLGALMVPMMIGMTDRGPESAGLAIFGAPVDETERKICVYSGFTAAGSSFDWHATAQAMAAALDIHATATANGNHGILTVSGASADARAWLKQHDPKLHILSTGRAIDLYKDIGSPRQVSDRYGFAGMRGTHLVGHTRMATESAVTPDRAHPFTAGEDFCLVHNGSLSNAHGIRRMLEPLGIRFETDNDTEAACRFIEWRLREGDHLETALQRAFETLDGFYTLLMGTADQLALVRDPFACKPAIVAETDDYVAIASEFRSLAHLPDIRNAHIFEPGPAQVYLWKA